MSGKHNRVRSRSAKGPSARRQRLSQNPRSGAATLDEIADVLHEVGIPAPKVAAALARFEQLVSSHTTAATPLSARVPSAAVLKRRESAERRQQEAATHFERALALEESDLNAARDAYMAALAAHSDHLEARINLGRLLHLQGNLREAEKIYRAARHSSAMLSFNLAILLEDL